MGLNICIHGPHRTLLSNEPTLASASVRDSRVQGEVVQGVVRVDREVLPQVEELLQGLVDEDYADERRKGLLREAGDVTHQRAGVRGHQHQAEEGRPQADAGPQ